MNEKRNHRLFRERASGRKSLSAILKSQLKNKIRIVISMQILVALFLDTVAESDAPKTKKIKSVIHFYAGRKNAADFSRVFACVRFMIRETFICVRV